jgi:hypothetical protein
MLASMFTGKDARVVVVSEASTFAGDFSVDFNGGAKGMLGSMDEAALFPILAAPVKAAASLIAPSAAPLSGSNLLASLGVPAAGQKVSSAAVTTASKPVTTSTPKPVVPQPPPPPPVKPTPAPAKSVPKTTSVTVSASNSSTLTPLSGKSLLTTLLA